MAVQSIRRVYEPVTFAQMVTPDEAARMLRDMRYDHQRPLRQGRVRAYAEEMRNGTFRELTQLFIAIYHGRHIILDGQHRLNAVVLAGKPQLFTIVEKDVESDTELARIYSTTDIGTRRTASDIYGAYALVEEFGLSKTLIDRLGTAVKFMSTGCLRTGELLRPDTAIPLMRLYAPYMQAYKGIIESGKVGEQMWSPTRRASTVAAALLTLRYSAPKAEREGRPSVQAFWEGAVLDDGLRVGDPRKAAYRHLHETRIQASHATRSNQVTRPPYSFRYLGRCLNNYIQGKGMNYGKVFDELGAVSIYGVPSDPQLWW